MWLGTIISRQLERNALSKEIRYIIAENFNKFFPIQEVPELVVEWGDEDRIIRDIKRGKLIIVLKSGRKNRYENIAKALISVIPDLLASEMRAVYDRKLLNCVSAHVARSIAKQNQAIVVEVNNAIEGLIKEDANLKEVSSMLVRIDDQSLFSRVLVTEMVEIARFRYPHRDPVLDNEIYELIELLYKLSAGEEVAEPYVYGKYVKVLFVRVARPEKIEMMLLPHIEFVNHILSKYTGIDRIYILAAGRNIPAAKKLMNLLIKK